MTEEHRHPWDDPSVKAALKGGRLVSDISLIRCHRCGNYGYYNDGSHFTCSVCEWGASGEMLDEMLDGGEVSTLDDYLAMQDEESTHAE